MWKGRLSMRYHGVNQISAFHFVRKWLHGEVTLSQIPELVGLTRSAKTMAYIKEKYYKQYRAEIGSRQALSDVERFNSWIKFLNSQKLHTTADIQMYSVPKIFDSFKRVSLTNAEHSQLSKLQKNHYRYDKQTCRWWILAFFYEQTSGYFSRSVLSRKELERKPFHWYRDEPITLQDPPGETPKTLSGTVADKGTRSLNSPHPPTPGLPVWLNSSSVPTKFRTMLAGIHAEMHTIDKWCRATDALNDLCALVPIRRGTRNHRKEVKFVPAAHPADTE